MSIRLLIFAATQAMYGMSKIVLADLEKAAASV
jgi:hypothetical protein